MVDSKINLEVLENKINLEVINKNRDLLRNINVMTDIFYISYLTWEKLSNHNFG